MMVQGIAKDRIRLLFCLLLSFVLLSPLLVPKPAHADGTGFVQASGDHFTLDGNPFYVAGTNHHYLHYAPQVEVDNALNEASAMGLNVIRIWGFIDIGKLDGTLSSWTAWGSNAYNGNTNGVYFQYWDPSAGAPAYNDTATGLRHLDYAIYKASQLGIKVDVVFTNNWYHYGGIDQYLKWYGLTNHNDFYTNTNVKTAFKNWISHLLNHVNYYTGVAYKNDTNIFSWELMNEPHGDGAPTTVVGNWATEMAAYVKSIDSNHLLSLGDEGFYSRGQSDWKYSGTTGMNYDAFIQIQDLDWGSYHLYPDYWSQTPSWGTSTWIPDHITVARNAGKPALLGEFGWKGTNKTTVYDDWTQAVEDNDGAGWLIWRTVGKQADGTYPVDGEGFDIHYPSNEATTLAAAAASITQSNGPVPAPGSFSLSLPAANATGVSVQPTFSWGASSHATSYHLVVSTNSSLSSPVINVSNLTVTSYTPTSSLSSNTVYYWKVTASNGTGSTADSNGVIHFTTGQPAPAGSVDNFETYGGANAALQSAYVRNTDGNAMTVTLNTANKSEGSYGMKIDYTVSSPNYAGVVRQLNNMNWSSGNALQLWLKPDGSNRTLTVQFKEASGEYWEAYYTLSGTTAATVQLPFSQFQHPGWATGGNNVKDLGQISQISLYINQNSGSTGSSTLYVDDMKVVNTTPPPSGGDIDSFEDYNGSSSALQSAYVRNFDGNSVTVTLDTANKNEGSYGMKYSYTIGSPNFAGMIHSLGGANWSGETGISLWLKPDGSNRTLTVQFKETSGELWEKYYTLSGTTATTIQLPFAQFQHPGWYSGGNNTRDLGSIAELNFYVNQGSGSTGSSNLYFDSIETY